MRDLRDMLNENTVKLQHSVSDWKEAVRIGGNMLLGIDACEPTYIDAMIHSAEELGPYYVIAPGLALPHARPEDGVRQTWFSLLTLKEPIEFGNEFNDPVHVVFCMAAKDKNEHIEALKQISALCSEIQQFDKIKYANNLKEIQDLFYPAGNIKKIVD